MEIVGLLILAALVIIIFQLKSIMENQGSTNDLFNELLNNLSTATTAAGERMERIIAELKGGGLTKAQEDALYERLSGEVAKVKALGNDPENPIPNEEEEEENESENA